MGGFRCLPAAAGRWLGQLGSESYKHPAGQQRVALSPAEAVTLSPGGVSDELYYQTPEHFSEKELVDLTWAVATINAWNRMSISFRVVPGGYKVKSVVAMTS